MFTTAANEHKCRVIQRAGWIIMDDRRTAVNPQTNEVLRIANAYEQVELSRPLGQENIRELMRH